jgi:hypothetical protein
MKAYPKTRLPRPERQLIIGFTGSLLHVPCLCLIPHVRQLGECSDGAQSPMGTNASKKIFASEMAYSDVIFAEVRGLLKKLATNCPKAVDLKWVRRYLLPSSKRGEFTSRFAWSCVGKVFCVGWIQRSYPHPHGSVRSLGARSERTGNR